MSAEARAYLANALDTLQATVLGRDTLPWRVIRDSAMLLASGAQRPSDTYGALNWALRRINKHSFLQASGPGAVSDVIRGRVAYLHIPQRGGRAQALADSLHEAVRSLQDSGVCGWIVDLRANGGGNMWPMLAGVGPLLGDSLVGAFGSQAGAPRWYYHRGVAGILDAADVLDTIARVGVPVVELREPRAPLAVLFDSGTGSSGEAIAVAFKGRPNSRSFGMPTAGFATANRGSRLPDGANMVLTTGYYTDRSGTEHPEQIQPDTVVESAQSDWPFARDGVASAAADWLMAQPACRDARR